MPSGKALSARLAFLDWTRGLAAILMLNGHVFHSFTHPDYRQGSLFVLTQFIGGMPPAIFLFLVGVTLAFLMESRERQGIAPRQRVLAAMRRGGYLLGLAFLFRVQLWLFAYPKSPWTDLFKVDILNAMGLAVVLMSTLALLSTGQRVRAGLVLGLMISFSAPLVSNLNWSWLPFPFAAYFVPDYNMFAFFPWAAFVAFGISAGSVLRLCRRDQLDRVMQWTALTGLLLILGARHFSDLPYSLYASSDFWLNSPWLIFIKLGVILLIASAAYLWTQYGASPGWSWVRQFGTTSLLVYWVHTELVYGRWFYFWKESLTPAQTVVASLVVILLMLGLSVIKTHWKRIKSGLADLVPPYLVPSRTPGD